MDLPSTAPRWVGWNGACAVSLATVHVGVGLLLAGGGCWAGGVPDAVLARWLQVLDHDRSAESPE